MMWNGPVCSMCNGSGAVVIAETDGRHAEICKSCNGTGLGKIGHGSTIRLSDHSEPIGSR